MRRLTRKFKRLAETTPPGFLEVVVWYMSNGEPLPKAIAKSKRWVRINGQWVTRDGKLVFEIPEV